MTKDEALRMALDALEHEAEIGNDDAYRKERDAIRKALAQPEQEPVANICIWHKNGEQHAELWNWDKGIETLPDGDHDLYTTSPQRKPLTDEEIILIVAECAASHQHTDIHFARAIEAKLKEKNT